MFAVFSCKIVLMCCAEIETTTISSHEAAALPPSLGPLGWEAAWLTFNRAVTHLQGGLEVEGFEWGPKEEVSL